MTQPKFNIGDKIIITALDDHDDFKTGDTAKIIEETKHSNVFIGLFENGKRESLRIGQMEKFIEPKFKIGYKFKIDGKESVIVQRALNKKKKEFYYMVYCVKHGCAAAFPEHEIPQIPVKMTLAEVSKALGKNVVIIK